MKIVSNLILISLLVCSTVYSQNGILFKHHASWPKVIAQAKKENKMIFVDAFTTWCGPCKYMSANIFTNEAVGQFFNKNFISVKVQMDTTSKDLTEVKRWYSTAHDMGIKYKIIAYPTFLFFDPGGKIVHRIVGSMEAEEFIDKSKSALDAEKQYYTLLRQFNNGKKAPDFLMKLISAAEVAYDMPVLSKAANQYLSNPDIDPITNENIDFLLKYTFHTSDKGFQLMQKNEDAINQKLNNTAATDKMVDIIIEDKISPIMTEDKDFEARLKKVQPVLQEKYSKLADKCILKSRLIYYKNIEDWHAFEIYVQQFMAKYGQSSTPEELNNFAWTIFDNSNNQLLLQEALKWSKKSLELKEEISYLDTYANLLYKTGNKTEAIIWEEKALEKASDADKRIFEATLTKMKSGVKTWKF